MGGPRDGFIMDGLTSLLAAGSFPFGEVVKGTDG
jgi:hypothetical protein